MQWNNFIIASNSIKYFWRFELNIQGLFDFLMLPLLRYLKADAIGSKATNQRQEKGFLRISFTPEPSALPPEPSHLFDSWSILCFFFKCWHLSLSYVYFSSFNLSERLVGIFNFSSSFNLKCWKLLFFILFYSTLANYQRNRSYTKK